MIISIEKNKTAIHYASGDSVPLTAEYNIKCEEHFASEKHINRIELDLLFSHERKIHFSNQTVVRFKCGCVDYELSPNWISMGYDEEKKMYMYKIGALQNLRIGKDT